MNSHHNILIIAPSWVGDFVIAQSLLITLKNKHPHAKITVFAGLWAKDLASRMPEIDHFIVNPFQHRQIKLLARYKTAQQIKELKFNTVYILPLSLKSALIPFFAKIPNRIGFIGESRYLLINKALKLNKKSLPRMVDRFVALANYTLPQQDLNQLSSPPYPKLIIDQNQQHLLLTKLGLTDKRIIFICPTAEYGPAKQWPWQHFASVAIMLMKRNYKIIMLGVKKDQQLGNKIYNKIKLQPALADNFHNLMGLTSLTEVIDLLSCADAIIANDSGLLHLAAATFANNCYQNSQKITVQTIIAIYGSTPPQIAPPLYENHKILYLNLPCSPCHNRTCKFGHYHCLYNIQPETVANLI